MLPFQFQDNGEVSKPFLADSKRNLLHWARAKPGVVRPFKSVKPQLESELRRIKAKEELKKIINKHRQKIKST